MNGVLTAPLDVPTESGGAAQVRLPAMCRLKDVGDLHRALQARLDVPGLVSIDAGEVESIDTGTLQLLFAFERDRCRLGHAIAYAGSSAVFRSALATLGLTLPALQAGRR